MSEEHDAFTEIESSEPMGEPLGPDKLLSLVCVLWLLNSAIGARVAVREGLPAEWVADLYVGRDASAEFFKGTGTALSPGLPMMVAQALFTLLSTRSGRVGMVGAAGLTLLGAGGTIGMLAETITYRVLSPKTFDSPKAAIVLSAIVLAPLMTILSWRRLRAVRSGQLTRPRRAVTALFTESPRRRVWYENRVESPIFMASGRPGKARNCPKRGTSNAPSGHSTGVRSGKWA